jgi:UDP-glucose:glycoprotein glucosyltransferase
MNGMNIRQDKVEAFSLLSLMRRERGLVGSLRGLGLTNPEAVKFLSHERIAEKIETGTTNRFDVRDEVEGGGVIIWLNDLEKDSRYKSWPTDIQNVPTHFLLMELMIGDASFIPWTITYDSEEHTSRGVCS